MSTTVGHLARLVASTTVSVTHRDVVVDDVEHDSRRVHPGALFACVRGSHTDGHLHAPEAVESGAVALLVEQPLGLGVPEVVVGDVRSVLGAVAAEVHGRPSDQLAVVGVTGTNGKTTTVTLLAEILRHAGRATTEIGTLTGARTTPEAPELQRTLAAAVSEGMEVVAMEVSSHALDLHRVDGVRFRVAGFTNLGNDHLDHHGTVEAYFAAKARLFEPSRSQHAVIDVTTPHGRLLAYSCRIPCTHLDETSFEVVELTAGHSRFRWRNRLVDVALGGHFNVKNAVLAAEIAVVLGCEPDIVASALAQAKPAPGRFEHIDLGQPYAVIVDYAHTPDGLEALLETARDVTKGRLVVVFGAGGDRDREKRPLMGEVTRRLADRVVVTSDNPRNEEPDTIIDAVVAGMARPPELIEADRRRAIRHAIAGARPGDTIVIAGKGHEPTQTIGSEVIEFDDRAVAREEVTRQMDQTR